MDQCMLAKHEICLPGEESDNSIEIKIEDLLTQPEIKQDIGLFGQTEEELLQFDHWNNPHNSEESYQCRQCNKTIIGKQNLIRHTKSHTGEKPYICNHCDKTFTRSDNLKTHMRRHIVKQSKINIVGDVANFTGKELFKPSKTEQSPIKHNIARAEDNLYHCTQCKKVFSLDKDFISHMRIHNGEKIYQCTECDKNFTTAPNLERHLKTHSGVKPFFCKFCNKAFTRNDNLKTHIKLKHSLLKLHNDVECSMSETPQDTFILNKFDESIHLLTKDQNHTNIIENRIEAYTCSICGEILFSKESFMSHNKAHTKKKIYNCSYCDKSFTIKREFQRHTIKHTGEKPYECNQCEMTFTGKQNLVRHLRAHTGEKPFQCDECGIAYSDNRDLNRHLRTHTGERPYQCNICGKTFTMNCYLLCHMRRQHAGE